MIHPPRTFVAVLAAGLVLAACSRAPNSPAATTTAAPSVTAGQSGPSTGAPVPTNNPPASNAAAPALSLDPVGSGLSAPIGLASAPGGWLLVNEQAGRVVALDPGTGATAEVVDLSDRVGGGGERGLLGLALAPDWPSDPRAFVHYTNADGNTVVSDLAGSQASDGPPVLDRDSERILLRVRQPFANHNGGQLAFGPDGYLYLGLGDGGSGGDPFGNGQDTHALLGKVLRFDASGGELAIPADNPFADGSDGAPEVFLYGLRNPWRFSFDSLTGDLWIGDVGQGSVEEIDRVDPRTDGGANLGWNLMEGSRCYTDGCSTDGLVLPVAEYGHDQGCSVTGGYVHRGEAFGSLEGWYLFADYCSGLLFGIDADATGVNEPVTLLQTDLSISAFGQDTAGELYLADHGSGTIYRIVVGGWASAPIARRLVHRPRPMTR